MSRDIFSGAQRLSGVEPSPIRAMIDRSRELREAGKPVVSLVAGEPDFNTPEPIKTAAAEALARNLTHYGSNRGDPDLRTKISAILSRETGVFYDPADELLVTCGGAEAINNALIATVNPGDEVIIFSPSFVSYKNLVRLCGGVPVEVPLRAENSFQIDPDETEASITPRTRMIILNNPCNPTGVTCREECLAGLAKLALKHDLLIFSDEIYRRLTYGEKFRSMASFPGMRERTVVLGGFSKTYAMTGWRLGYLAADRRHMRYLVRLHQYSTTCAPTFLQAGVAAAVDLPETRDLVQRMADEFAARRALLMQLIDTIPGLAYVPPTGAFYLFLDVYRTGLSGEKFSRRLIEEQYVGTVPGIGFGTECGDFVRLSFATSQENLREAAGRIDAFIRSLRAAEPVGVYACGV